MLFFFSFHNIYKWKNLSKEMNLRLRKGKVIWSIIIPVLFWLFLILFSKVITVKSLIIKNFFAMHNLTNILSTENIILFVIEVVVIYLILSVFQRKTSFPNVNRQMK
jgi:carbon starvation protein CstA